MGRWWWNGEQMGGAFQTWTVEQLIGVWVVVGCGLLVVLCCVGGDGVW